MLNLDFICQHPQIVREALHKRHEKFNLDDVLRLAEQRRDLMLRCDGLYTSLKRLKETISHAPVTSRQALNLQVKIIGQDVRQLELQRAEIDTRLQLLLQNLPNLPHPSVPEGNSKPNDQELRTWGHPLTLSFEPLAHWDLGERLGIIDVEAGTRIAGSRFVALKGAGARLERALISFMLDVHTRDHGYVEIIPPHLVKRSIILGAGQPPKFEDQTYICSVDDLYLNSTAEVPLVGMHYNTIIAFDMLPLRYVAWTTAFQREMGSIASRQTRGLSHLHQFNEVKLFQIVVPQDSYNVFRQVLQHAENILQQLELSYRVVELCARNLPFSAAKTVDLEVWMAGQKRYMQISSVSNCETFQAARANIKYRPTKSTNAEYVHTLNASGLAVSRTMAAILEAYQQADGSVVIPKVLRPYMRVSQLSVQGT